MLTWSNLPSTNAYTVEWAPDLSGTWYNSWAPLCYVGPVTGGTSGVQVPMFYRVVTASNPPPDAIFVSSSGANASDCGDRDSPCATISFGISRAVNESRSVVVVGHGVYEEHVTLIDGISVLGGYGPAPYWCELPACRPILQAGPHESETVLANGIESAETRLEGFMIHAPNAVEPGANSIGVRVLDSNANLVIQNNCIVAQAAADGAAGAAGEDGPAGGSGAPGRMAIEITANSGFNNSGGGGGANTSLGGGSLNGGAGGSSTGPVTYDALEGNGLAGNGFSSGGGGAAGRNGKIESPNCSLYVLPVSGTGSINGVGGASGGGGADGSGGAGASGAAGSFIGGQWVGNSGSSGGSGTDGSGGGGGGAGGGSKDIGCNGDDVGGASGGGGGAGGAGARAGAGGGSGGGSFGILLYGSFSATRPVIQNNEIFLGVAGDGGKGGNGGEGGAGGLGGEPQNPVPFIFGHGTAGAGGGGGDGGDGGGGGGGAGGSSAGIIMNFAAPEYSGANIFHTLQGRAGKAGSGGFSKGSGAGADGVIGAFSDVLSLP